VAYHWRTAGVFRARLSDRADVSQCSAPAPLCPDMGDRAVALGRELLAARAPPRRKQREQNKDRNHRHEDANGDRREGSDVSR
jgi:hypothetical protein